ncbi:MAG: hypothetical protein IK109_05865 [Clostridiales bacterium]|nr:hypothetical protein [Clostridiales bacterium]MBR5417547.1 hypothetical protein [Clostridiales bacterium]
MKKCPVCGLMLKDEALRCTMCNNVFEVNMTQEELDALNAAEQKDPLEDEFEAFFKDQPALDPKSAFAPVKDNNLWEPEKY